MKKEYNNLRINPNYASGGFLLMLECQVRGYLWKIKFFLKVHNEFEKFKAWATELYNRAKVVTFSNFFPLQHLYIWFGGKVEVAFVCLDLSFCYTVLLCAKALFHVDTPVWKTNPTIIRVKLYTNTLLYKSNWNTTFKKNVYSAMSFKLNSFQL